MNRKIHKMATLAGLSAGLIGTGALSTPAFAMTELAQGYALGTAAQQNATPPPAQHEHATSTQQQSASSADPHDRQDERRAADTAQPAQHDKVKDKDKDKHADAGKQMSEGKCGEGKCGGAA